jgi:serine/threonine-protein kinase HipA
MGWVLSPFYDLINVKMILPKDKEDLALLLGGKKENFNKGYFDRFGASLKLNEKQVNGVYKRLQIWLPEANQLIERSFLDSARQKAYKELIDKRVKLFIA